MKSSIFAMELPLGERKMSQSKFWHAACKRKNAAHKSSPAAKLIVFEVSFDYTFLQNIMRVNAL